MTGMHTLKTALSGSVAAIALLAAGASAQAAEANTSPEDLRARLEAQQAELDRMRERLEEVETTQEEQQTVAPAQAVTAGDTPRSFKIPGTNTSLNIGGYIKGDLIYDIDEDLGDTFAASAISPEVPGAVTNDGTFRAHAKQSRLWFKTSTPTEMGDLKTHLEADFFNGVGNEVVSNSSTFRLRHAYGQLGGLLVGQTWTNFMSLHSYADTVDFFGPAGMPFVRQAQIRYTFKPSDNLDLAFAVENAEISGRIDAATALVLDPLDAEQSFASEPGFGLDTLPDLTARVKYSSDRWTGVLAGIVRPGMEIEQTADLPNTSGQSETGWGAHASLGVSIANSYLFVNGTFGEGIGRYMINGGANGLFVDEVAGTVTAPKMWAVVPGIDIGWNDKWRSVLVWGHNEFDDTFEPGDLETIDTVHANLWWTPVENARFGLEYMYGAVEFNDNTDGDANRIQFAAQYSF